MPDMMEWLRAGIPLTLGMDLLDPTGPDSRRLYADERASLDWVPPRAA